MYDPLYNEIQASNVYMSFLRQITTETTYSPPAVQGKYK